jgi:hypothetical protein
VLCATSSPLPLWQFVICDLLPLPLPRPSTSIMSCAHLDLLSDLPATHPAIPSRSTEASSHFRATPIPHSSSTLIALPFLSYSCCTPCPKTSCKPQPMPRLHPFQNPHMCYSIHIRQNRLTVSIFIHPSCYCLQYRAITYYSPVLLARSLACT